MDILLTVAALATLVFLGVRWRLRDAHRFDTTSLRAGEPAPSHPSDVAARASGGSAWTRIGGSGA